MPIDLDAFKLAYKKWVEESLPDYRAGNMKEIVKKYPFIAPDDIPWTALQAASRRSQTFAAGHQRRLLPQGQPAAVRHRVNPRRYILSRNPQNRSPGKTSALLMRITITAWQSKTSTSSFPSSASSNWKMKASSAS